MAAGFAVAEALMDAVLARLRPFHGARPLSLAPLVPLSSPLAAEYCTHFPHLACSVSLPESEPEPGKSAGDREFLLSPTCCYPVFWSQREQELPAGTCFTFKSWCFRNEAHVEPWRRERAFRMREYVWFGDADAAEAWAGEVAERIEALLDGFDLVPRVEVATDHFFDTESIKRKIQLDQQLKREFLTDGLSVGSINLHLNAICKKFGIRSDGGVAFSACFGMGYQRLWYSLCRVHGVDGALACLRAAAA
jgi:hypothetical protein